MPQATFRFYAELNDFLPPSRRQEFAYEFQGRGSVKDLIEALGVPHPEVDLILVNGVSVDFGCLVQDGDRVSVYPVFESLAIEPAVRLRPHPLREPRFVLDVHLGKLTTYLRLLGFDTLYRNDYADPELARISSEEGRLLLTRDRGLLKRGVVSHGYYVRATEPLAQLLEVLRRFDLFEAIQPFHRCVRCNGAVEPVAKEAVLEFLLPKTRLYYDEFYRCVECGRIYWRGSHYERMQRLVDRIRQAASTDT
ncbi:MAG: Mut7-C ubiquitin/RNAse domain-containing protein [Anaerolineae bacterium]|nr:Mut7-C ubiquitin/RNAse domain-containing protein [Anaerolineae bacterium]